MGVISALLGVCLSWVQSKIKSSQMPKRWKCARVSDHWILKTILSWWNSGSSSWCLWGTLNKEPLAFYILPAGVWWSGVFLVCPVPGHWLAPQAPRPSAEPSLSYSLAHQIWLFSLIHHQDHKSTSCWGCRNACSCWSTAAGWQPCRQSGHLEGCGRVSLVPAVLHTSELLLLVLAGTRPGTTGSYKQSVFKESSHIQTHDLGRDFNLFLS